MDSNPSSDPPNTTGGATQSNDANSTDRAPRSGSAFKRFVSGVGALFSLRDRAYDVGLSSDDRSRLAKAVDAAESRCGIQIMLYIGKTGANTREAAIALLRKQGFETTPGVLLLVEPKKRKVEVVTSEQAKPRIPDSVCTTIIAMMLPHFQQGAWVKGIEIGVASLAHAAGEGLEDPHGELPDILEH